MIVRLRVFFFFQAEDGIRDSSVTGVQTCALPICIVESRARTMRSRLTAARDPLARFPARIARERRHLEAVVATLNAVSPLSVLSRGYAIAFSRTRNRRT